MALTASEESAYQSFRQSAERAVSERISAYKQKIEATIEYESIMMRKEQREGDDIAAGRHRIRIEIYHSILERI